MKFVVDLAVVVVRIVRELQELKRDQAELLDPSCL